MPAGYGWSFPADDEVRVGVGSFDPRFHVKQPTVELAGGSSASAVRYQGNWIPHKLRAAIEDDVFFAGDSAGHCLPLTAEGIRTAFYFGIALGRELREVMEGRATRDDRAAPLRDVLRTATSWKFSWMLRAQRLVPRVPPRLLSLAGARDGHAPFTHWAFAHYLAMAPPSFVGEAPRGAAREPALAA